MDGLKIYLTNLHNIRATGAAVPETSYYPVLANLFNEIGKTLKPKVHYVSNIQNKGAGIPDGGLFTDDQLCRNAEGKPQEGQLPTRGAVEVKSPADDVRQIAQSTQICKYVKKYGLVLVTNYRDFLIVGSEVASGNPLPMESCSLAISEDEFWHKVANPNLITEEHGKQFLEFLKRAMLHAVPLTAPKDVAWFLASYARDALVLVKQRESLPALANVRKSLEEALDMKFTTNSGEHFFRSTLVQTIFYGIFAAWVLWRRKAASQENKFNWRMAEWSLNIPIIRRIYHELNDPAQLGQLGLVEVLDWTEGVLNRVDCAEFFKSFQEEHAVQYFYEPFLMAFDPELRKQLGIWYTPPEIVKYQVARVDTALREELDIIDGLADPDVVVLDPCCGTGAYLVEVLRKIAETLRNKGSDALLASDLKQAAMNRVFGFEILPAPFVISHLQLGLLLQDEGAPLSPGTNERAGIYLTNALTGWEPPKGPKQLFFPELQEEKDAAEKVKRNAKILVVIGNPPYNAYAGISPEEEGGIVEPYKKNLNTPAKDGGWGIKKFNLDDLYVRFFRLAERRIAEMSGKGIVSFISNSSYLHDPSFVVMRQRYLEEFDRLWFDCMNGDSRATGKLTPEGNPDPSVFSTEYNRAGIRVGTTVSVIVRKQIRDQKATVLFRHFWGTSKRQQLVDSLNTQGFDAAYVAATPCRENRFSFYPENSLADYNAWPKLIELCEIPPPNGLMEKRGGALFDIDRDKLEKRMRGYFDSNLNWDEYKVRHSALTQKYASFDPKQTRAKAIKAEPFMPGRILPYAIRPFEVLWCYYTQVSPIWNRARPALWEQCFDGNTFVLSRMNPSRDPEGSPMYFCTGLFDDGTYCRHAVCFPIRLKPMTRQDTKQRSLFGSIPQK